MYEAKHQPPLPRRRFTARLLTHFAVAFALLVVSLAIGVAGYSCFEDLSFLDALLNSAMLLGGMGPVADPITPHGKVFASLYALYAGLFFIVTAALLLTPVVHRLLHKFHWNEKC